MYKQLSIKLSKWIYSKVRNSGAGGCIIGISGGVDSAVVAALCKNVFPSSTLAYHVNCHNNPRDIDDALLVAESLNIPIEVLELDSHYDSFISTLSNHMSSQPRNPLYASNVKPRMRMAALYFYSQVYHYLVIGTGNKSELSIGYFTKHGDGGVDILPIGNLVKTQVWELAKYLGIPERVINKAPSAGLWPNQTDEGEIGITYQQLDRYLLTGQAELNIQAKIDRLIIKNEHKLKLPQIPRIK